MYFLLNVSFRVAKITKSKERGKVVAEKIHTMSKRYRPIGGNKEKTADVRIDEDMQSAVAEKRFRQDLFHRIKEYTLHIPPLRECREDIMPLAEFFRELANKEFGKQVKGFNAEARKRMLVHPWAGNVRELKGTVRSAVLFTDGIGLRLTNWSSRKVSYLVKRHYP